MKFLNLEIFVIQEIQEESNIIEFPTNYLVKRFDNETPEMIIPRNRYLTIRERDWEEINEDPDFHQLPIEMLQQFEGVNGITFTAIEEETNSNNTTVSANEAPTTQQTQDTQIAEIKQEIQKITNELLQEKIILPPRPNCKLKKSNKSRKQQNQIDNAKQSCKMSTEEVNQFSNSQFNFTQSVSN